MATRRVFLAGNLLLCGVFLLAFVADSRREWKGYQREYFRRLGVRGELGLRQVVLGDLGRVDRCVSCHLGMDEFAPPAPERVLLDNPYKAHPDLGGLLRKHPVRKFGCTACHGGQGLATTASAAHEGHVARLAEGLESERDPLLRGPFLQAACARCHADFANLPELALVASGRRLFEENGCGGCHAVAGAGGGVSVDAEDMADKPSEWISARDFQRSRMPAEHGRVSSKSWILAHLLRDPAEFVRNDPEGRYYGEPVAPSGMPPYSLEWGAEAAGQATALTVYLLSLSRRSIPSVYYRPALPVSAPSFHDPVERGRQVFRKAGCAGCHGKDGEGGRRNFNAGKPGLHDPARDMAEGRVPALKEMVGQLGPYVRDKEIRAKLLDGAPPSKIAKLNAEGPTPPLYMPAWRDRLSEDELSALVAYLLTLARKEALPE